MTKQELIKKYREIVLKTNGGNDDYVIALCQIGNAISELDEPDEQIAEFKHQLDEKIKELEEKLETKESINRAYDATLRLKDYDFSDLVRENQQLKQSQNSKAIEVLKQVETEIYKHCGVIGECYLDKVDFERLFKNKITELRGDKNEQS